MQQNQVIQAYRMMPYRDYTNVWMIKKMNNRQPTNLPNKYDRGLFWEFVFWFTMQPGKPGHNISQQQPDEFTLGPEITTLIKKIAWQNRLLVATPILFILATIIFGNIDTGVGVFLGVASFFAILSVVIRLFIGSDKFKKKYRQTIVNSFLRNAFNQVEYEPNSFLNLKEFWYSGLSESVPNNYNANNYIKIERPDYVLETTYIDASRIYNRNDENNTGETELLHAGLFMKYSMKAHFPTQMIILKDTSGVSWVNMNGGPEFIFNTFNRIRIKNLEFEKHYEVYTKDDDKGYAFLDASIQQFLLDLKSKAKNKVQVSFMDNCMYISIEKEVELFQPGFILLANGNTAQRTAREVKWLQSIVEFIHPQIEKWIEKYGY